MAKQDGPTVLLFPVSSLWPSIQVLMITDEDKTHLTELVMQALDSIDDLAPNAVLTDAVLIYEVGMPDEGGDGYTISSWHSTTYRQSVVIGLLQQTLSALLVAEDDE